MQHFDSLEWLTLYALYYRTGRTRVCLVCLSNMRVIKSRNPFTGSVSVKVYDKEISSVPTLSGLLTF